MSERDVLLVYTSREGQTAKIMACIQDVLEADGAQVTTRRLSDAEESVPDIASFSKVVLAGSIHYGKHEKHLAAFIKAHKAQLEDTTTVFFSVNLTARKPNKNTVDTNPYIKRFLAEVDWQPSVAHVFAGALLYSKYKWSDKMIIRFIMWMTKGNTDTSRDIDYTDWADVRHFAERVSKLH
ncbi:menaquinone-dependent protoporphyrinogen IX dehydrogenase [Echinimonas agarilytica]|uniref:Protoporphyrinogen IX dehydrogenase [quinone] n=1 Tax=Echinimonas agarilytica TaxID=1215918 RepID=A0AA42B5Q5_9GAMM|nr:menaquinone-dependent protoporphyrinogen IX dehydrogenase [Echinimonas agarilytica]MCM2678068.1 menaquinone-dependent protoporphyrinogen IX dehydrogenase [Echinimonas agarilytica]